MRLRFSREGRFSGSPRRGAADGSRQPPRRARGIARVALAIAVCAVGRPGLGQLLSDDVPRERLIATQLQVEADVERSRYHVGPFFVLPELYFRNFGYDSNVFGVPEADGPVRDWVADVQAGARIVARVGNRMYFRAEALPEYFWYLHTAGLRHLGGYYQGSWIGFFNRLSFEANASTTYTTDVLNSETLALMRTRFEAASATVEVEAFGPVSLFGRGEAQRRSYFPEAGSPAEIQNANELNRTEEAATGGIRVRVRSNLDLTGAYEETKSHFFLAPEQFDNRSTAYLGGLHYSGPRFYLNLSGGLREGRPENGSTFPAYKTGTGSYFVSFFPLRKLELQAYGRRGTGYGLTAENPYYFETSNGGGINISLGRRIVLRGFGEYGINDFPVPVTINTGVTVIRKDTLTNYGGGFSVGLLRQTVLTATASKIQLDSNVPGQSRTVVRYATSINFQGDFSR